MLPAFHICCSHPNNRINRTGRKGEKRRGQKNEGHEDSVRKCENVESGKGSGQKEPRRNEGEEGRW